LQIQAKLVRLGATLGFNIWVAAGDRNKVSELLSDEHRAKLVATLPLNFDLATMKTIENIRCHLAGTPRHCARIRGRAHDDDLQWPATDG
jgi:hypothetical protein